VGCLPDRGPLGDEMKLRTVVRDCLFLNWALPVAALPEPPPGLRYQRHEWHGADYTFASALLFHHDAVRWSAFPLLRIGYPQLNVRLYVVDGDGVPAVLFLRELMPVWAAPAVRLLSRHPAASARLDFPRPSRQAEAGSWHWRAQRGGTLSVHAWVHSPAVGEGPRIGTWEETVHYFQDRPRGYAEHDGTLHRVNASHPPADDVWPLAAEVEGSGEMLALLAPAGSGAAAAAAWPALHSCWLCPEMPFSVVFDLLPGVHHVVNGLPHPAAGRVSTRALFSRVRRPRRPRGPQGPPGGVPAGGPSPAAAAAAAAAQPSLPALPALSGAEMTSAPGVLASAA
jgi:hypothetical protein